MTVGSSKSDRARRPGDRPQGGGGRPHAVEVPKRRNMWSPSTAARQKVTSVTAMSGRWPADGAAPSGPVARAVPSDTLSMGGGGPVPERVRVSCVRGARANPGRRRRDGGDRPRRPSRRGSRTVRVWPERSLGAVAGDTMRCVTAGSNRGNERTNGPRDGPACSRAASHHANALQRAGCGEMPVRQESAPSRLYHQSWGHLKRPWSRGRRERRSTPCAARVLWSTPTKPIASVETASAAA